MIVGGKHYRSVWLEGGTVFMLNQSVLPHRFEIFESPDHQRTTRALSNFIVRGAGVVGTAAGFALAQAVLEAPEKEFDSYIATAVDELLKLAVSPHTVAYSVERIYRKVKKAADPPAAKKAAVAEALALAEADIKACLKIGELGATLISDGIRVLIHGSGGWLSSTDWGTSLSPVYQAKRAGKNAFVWVGEGRPGFQGARLIAWELKQEDIPFALIADAAAGFFMSRGETDLVIVGCERIARNGDILARIGTYDKAVLAKTNKVPFYVATPLKNLDPHCSSGRHFPIVERSEDEVAKITGRDEVNALHTVTVLPEGVTARNPHHDVTPAKYVTGYITEKGILTLDKFKALKPEGAA
ncbi:MAG: s-methyl-5-thioribose-1-phosphate isomerase [Spirochaetales bacterium]|nr:s-methyl-5-thioribose-1-phosphate isomerase [Spirochaetales bacterium]